MIVFRVRTPSSYRCLNGLARSYTYNAQLQVTEIKDTLGGNTKLDLGYTLAA